jgi:CBS domain-containing protein
MNRDTVQDIGDLMTGDLIAVRPSDRVGRALDILLRSGLHALPVVDDGGIAVGLVTTADLVPVDADELLGERFYGPPITMDRQSQISEAAGVMRQEFVHHIIVTEDDLAVGMLSSYDLLKMLESEA